MPDPKRNIDLTVGGLVRIKGVPGLYKLTEVVLVAVEGVENPSAHIMCLVGDVISVEAT